MRPSRLLRHASHGPWGDSKRHRPLQELERELAKLSPPADTGTLRLIVARGDDGVRETPERVRATPEGGIPGDAWLRDSPDKLDAQITLIRADVAELIANGQPLTLFGDNLVVDLDLSQGNVPTGTHIRLGEALLEVTPEPHTGCTKFRQRFGGDALRLTADRRYRDMRLRGIYCKTVESGEIALGDSLEVLSRGD